MTKRRGVWLASAAVVCGVAVGGWWFFGRGSTKTLTEKDTVVLADFVNGTGDPVFDDSLKQALVVDLGQSPFLNILSDQKVRATLHDMTRPPDARLTDETVREVCQRSASKAFISGSIDVLGNNSILQDGGGYVIGLNAINCVTGATMAQQRVQAADKGKVIGTLGRAATKLRSQLGESLTSVQKFDVPPERATTSSLEALKAFSTGRKQGIASSISFYQRAVDLDPNFASAYVRLGITYDGLGKHELAREFITKAFQLREHASEREALHIDSLYYLVVTGELEKALKTCELWTQSYPRDWLPLLDLGVVYVAMGQYEKAVDATRESLKFHPDNVTAYENLAGFSMALNRFAAAKDFTAQAQARKLDDEIIHTNLYGLAFLEGDTAGMAQQVAWFAGKADYVSDIYALESATEAYFGRLGKARELTGRAVAAAKSAQNKDSAALWSADAALREALLGNYVAAREQAGAARSLAPGGSDAIAETALALALTGDTTRAKAITDELNTRFPVNSVIQSFWLPTIRAQMAINRKEPGSAIEQLQTVESYETGLIPGPINYSCLYPVYVRGEAYLADGQGAEATTEYQKILVHRGLVQNCLTGSLAELGLARAYALQRDPAKAREAYQNFFTLWKGADPETPVLKQAKAQYGLLK